MNSPDNNQQEESSQSLSDVIAEQWDQMESAEVEEVETEEVDTEFEAEASDDGESVEVEEEVEAAAEPDQELQEEIEDAADAEYSTPAPERWPHEIQEVYNAQPPAVRKAMLEGIYKPMQRSYTEATKQLSEMREQMKPVFETMERFKGDFQKMGVTPEQAFDTQMAWASHLSRVGPEQGIRDMAAAYGIGKGSNKPAGQEEYLTPTERGLKSQLDELRQQVAGTQQFQQQTTQQAQLERQEQYKAEIQTNLNTFINEKTEDGKLAHPHMDKVASNIAGIIRGGLVTKTDEYGQPVSMRDQLSQAYNMACNLDPSIRTPLPSKGQARRVRAAQKVGVVTKAPVGHESVDSELSTTEFIEQQWEKLNRRTA
jgi:hypothetical protein